MTKYVKDIVKTVQQQKPGFTPKIGIILGSGLGPLAEQIEDVTTISYDKLPGFPKCGVVGHAGNLLLGTIKGIPVACLQGRAHVYEGNIEVIRTIVRTLKAIGCEIMMQTNAAGSFHEKAGPGSLMLINDHINFQFFNPLVGPNDSDFGSRFVSMENAYDKELREKILQIVEKENIPLSQGVYLGVSGPCFETPAEINAYRMLGADAVGMSTVPETIIARHCGMKVVAISAITNMVAGLNKEELSHEQTLRCAQLAVDKLMKLTLKFLENL